MKIGFIGLGKMGKNMVLNLNNKGHFIVAYDKSLKALKEIKGKNTIIAYSIKELIDKLPKKKIIWLMIPAGKPVDDVISQLLVYLKKGDVIVDGGNSYYKDSIKRYKELKKKGICFLDVGTSGGINGARNGACMMMGGDYFIFKKLDLLFKSMCVKNGYSYVGKAGAGHFVKMIHNGIEYGMMGAIAEGLDATRKFSSKFKISLKEVVKVYNHGSIIEGKLMNYLLNGIKNPKFKKIVGTVPYGCTEKEMKKLEGISEMQILNKARLMRVKSRRKPSFKGKIVAILRNQFGGHTIIKK